VLWLLEELGVPYEIVRYQRQPDMRAPNEFRPFIRSANRP
jgi:glutathione S-transferase